MQVLRSIPELDQAAIDAVKQWEYVPLLVDGVPTPMTIDDDDTVLAAVRCWVVP